MKTSVQERAKIRLLHGQGYSDREIAEQIGRSTWTVYEWRRNMKLSGLPQNCRARVKKLHGEGMLDREIAESLSRHKTISAPRVSMIRKSLGLAPHKRCIPGNQRAKIGDQVKYRCRQLKTDAQIARLYRGLSYA